MSAQPTLDTIDARLAHVETKLDQIHVALVGSADGAVKGLQMRFDGLAARVERLEGWGRWLSGVVTALIIAAAIQAWKG